MFSPFSIRAITPAITLSFLALLLSSFPSPLSSSPSQNWVKKRRRRQEEEGEEKANKYLPDQTVDHKRV